MFRSFIAPPKKTKFHFIVSCFVLYCWCHVPFEIWNEILKGKGILEVIAINGRIILKCILKK